MRKSIEPSETLNSPPTPSPYHLHPVTHPPAVALSVALEGIPPKSQQ